MYWQELYGAEYVLREITNARQFGVAQFFPGHFLFYMAGDIASA
jgi:hypothetical protein